MAKDVCDCLELDLASGARGLDDDEKGLHTMQTPGGALEMLRDAGVDEKGVTTNYTPGGMQDIPGEWKGRNWIMTPGGEQEMSMISGIAKCYPLPRP